MIRRIRRSELGALAVWSHFTIDGEDLDEYEKLADFVSETIATINEFPLPPPENVPAVRDPGDEAGDDDDPYNAVVRWCSVRVDGATGVLAGRRIGLKDSVAVAGVPLTGGSTVLRNFVPTADSVVTRRVLEAGGEVVAMLNMDYLAFSGGGESSAYGPTLCPFDTSRTAGGSSGGSGAALYYDDIDITIGCDQGGSIRVPAAWCGVIGLKPTYGLIPYVGILGIDGPIDHVGPMARSTADMALMLQVLAGKDDSDPRQPAAVPVADYVRAVGEAGSELSGLRIGAVTEGFSPDVGMEDETEAAVRGALERFAELGAEVETVSVPEHLRAGGLAFTGFIEGIGSLLEGGGNGFGWNGRYSPELSRALVQGLKAYGDELSPQVKLALACATHLRRQYGGELYARGHNLHGWLRAAYDRALDNFDVLVMPTTPWPPHLHDPNASISDHVLRGWAMLTNTAPTDITGHPAITLPAAEVDGLPVGVMVIGRHFADDRLLALARTYEQQYGWAPPHAGDPRKLHRVGADIGT